MVDTLYLKCNTSVSRFKSGHRHILNFFVKIIKFVLDYQFYPLIYTKYFINFNLVKINGIQIEIYFEIENK